MANLDVTLAEMDRNFLKLRFHVKEQVTSAKSARSWRAVKSRQSAPRQASAGP